MSFYSFAKIIVRPISAVFFPVKVHGDPNLLPQDGGVILCANHVSFLDVIFLALTFKRQIHFVGKEKYAHKPILKQLFKWLGAFGINTDKPDIAAIKRCISIPKDGKVLGIFPEGTRIINGKESIPMPGTAMIAQKSGAPIFYARIKPRHGQFRLFSRTDVYVGQLINTVQLGVTSGRGSEYKTAADNLMTLIYSLGDE